MTVPVKIAPPLSYKGLLSAFLSKSPVDDVDDIAKITFQGTRSDIWIIVLRKIAPGGRRLFRANGKKLLIADDDALEILVGGSLPEPSLKEIELEVNMPSALTGALM